MRNCKCKILLVEDSKIARKIATLLLTELGCHVEAAETGTKAIELINENHYDLIFLDLGLDDMDGIAVMENIRNTKNLNSEIPIIILTAHDTPDIRDHCQRVGSNDFLVKPFTLEIGKQILEKYCSK